jgi:tetratricopeptide (TPR) repeat protein
MQYKCVLRLVCGTVLTLLAGLVSAQSLPGTQPPDAPEGYVQALEALDKGDLERAEQHLNEVIQQQPEWAGAWLDLALLVLRQQRYSEAEELVLILEKKFHPLPDGIQAAVDLMHQQLASYLRSSEQLKATTQDKFSAVALAVGYDSNANSGLDMSAITLTLPGASATLNIDSSSQAKGAVYARAGWARQASQTWDTGKITWQIKAQARQNRGLSTHDSVELFPQATLAHDVLPGEVIAAWQALWVNASQVYEAPVLRWQNNRALFSCDWQNLLQAEARQYNQARYLDSHWWAYRATLFCKHGQQRRKFHAQVAKENALSAERPGGNTRHHNIGVQQEWLNLGDLDQHSLLLKLDVQQSKDAVGYNNLLDNGNVRRVRRTDLQLTWSAPLSQKPEWRWSLGLQLNVQKSNIAFFNQQNNALETSIWRVW